MKVASYKFHQTVKVPLFKQKRQVNIIMRKSGGGTPWHLGGGVPPGSPNHDPLSDKKNAIPDPFSDQILNSIPVFRPGARFSKVPITFRARNQIFKSKYKE